MNDDAELLSEYARNGSDAAFTELVRRHVDLVHSAALRLTGGDAHRAEDVSQQVFTELARQAGRLAKHPALLGWLYYGETLTMRDWLGAAMIVVALILVRMKPKGGPALHEAAAAAN